MPSSPANTGTTAGAPQAQPGQTVSSEPSSVSSSDTAAGGVAPAEAGNASATGGNRLRSGDWTGELYLVADPTTTFAPANFASRGSGEAVCVSGVVPASADFGSFFELGINLNQQPGGSANAATLQGMGLALRLRQNMPGALRAQIVNPNSSQDNTRWCANLSGAGPYLLPWTSFNTACWDGSGDNFDASPLRSIAVVVPGSNVVDTPFDFCIEGFADAQSAEQAVFE